MSKRSARVEWIRAPGSPPMTRAQVAMYAASQPFVHARTDATGGTNGAASADANASPRSGTIAGAASAFAGIVSTDSAWNWTHITGAVASPHAADTAMASRNQSGIGYPTRARCRGGTSTKIAVTATNDSWKPASNSVYGFHASNASAPSSRKCQRSAIRAVSHASETSAPAIPARITEGCGPTARTYAAIPASAQSSPIHRESPTSQARPTAPSATSATFWP